MYFIAYSQYNHAIAFPATAVKSLMLPWVKRLKYSVHWSQNLGRWTPVHVRQESSAVLMLGTPWLCLLWVSMNSFGVQFERLCLNIFAQKFSLWLAYASVTVACGLHLRVFQRGHGSVQVKQDSVGITGTSTKMVTITKEGLHSNSQLLYFNTNSAFGSSSFFLVTSLLQGLLWCLC